MRYSAMLTVNTDEIIQKFAQRMETRMQEITEKFMKELNFSGLEAALDEECAKLNAELQFTTVHLFFF